MVSNKIQTILNRKPELSDYELAINAKWETMTKEQVEKFGSKRNPSFKEAISALKRLYRLIMGKPLSKKYTFKETSGNRHTWCRRGVWSFNTNARRKGFIRQDGSRAEDTWLELSHSISHWLCLRKHPNAKGHSIYQWRIEKECANYCMKHKFHLGSLIRESKPKVEVSKDVLLVTRLKKNISSWEKKIKRANTFIKKYSKQLKYYEKKIADGVVPKVRAKGYKVESYKQKTLQLLTVLSDVHNLYARMHVYDEYGCIEDVREYLSPELVDTPPSTTPDDRLPKGFKTFPMELKLYRGDEEEEVIDTTCASWKDVYEELSNAPIN